MWKTSSLIVKWVESLNQFDSKKMILWGSLGNIASKDKERKLKTESADTWDEFGDNRVWSIGIFKTFALPEWTWIVLVSQRTP